VNNGLPAVEIIQSTSWWALLVSAFGGAILTLIGSWFVEWIKRPKLKIDFEERQGIKPYIIELDDHIGIVIHRASSSRNKYLRLRVKNVGRQLAKRCEAKISIEVAEKNAQVSNSYLHWARRDLLLYTTGLDISQPKTSYEKAFEPIDINRGEEEYLEVLKMNYWYTGNRLPDTIKPDFESSSIPDIALIIQPNTKYVIKVTVYSSNAKPVCKNFFLEKWDGTINGFGANIVKPK